MGTFYLKENDTSPTFETVLKDPDGTVHDLTNADTLTLHILLTNGTKLERTLTVYGTATDGTVRYTWLSTDWGTTKLISGSHRMEYEIIEGVQRLTFPNDGYDILKITADIADG